MTGPLENKTSYKTTGGANVPGSVTKQPKNSYAYDNTKAPFNHDGNDVSGYIGVDDYYRTYSDTRNKPINTAGASNGYNLADSEGRVGTAEAAFDPENLPRLVEGSGVELSGPVHHETLSADEGEQDANANEPKTASDVVARLSAEQRADLRRALDSEDDKSSEKPEQKSDDSDKPEFKTKAEAKAFAEKNQLQVDEDLKSDEYQAEVKKAYAAKHTHSGPAAPSPSA